MDFDLTPLAQRDLIEIQDYIAQNNPIAAARVIDECFECFVKLADQPFIGHTREDLTAREVRFWNLYSYMIIYSQFG
jgi:plasmid stabilization system protein ParE